MAIFWPVVGVVLIATIAWEVFHDLFHPGGTGALSDFVGRTFFESFKRFPRLLGVAGPLALVTVIALWVAGLVFGFAFVYLAAYPAGFRTSTGDVPPPSAPFVSVFYFSFETLITLGYGDIVPRSWVIRLVGSLRE